MQRCPRCDARWSGRDARWCGWCGARLRPDPPAPRRRRWLRALRAAGAIVVVAVLLAGLVRAVVDAAGQVGHTERERVDGDVELRIDEPQLVAPSEVARPACTPRGCERWHVPRLAGQRAIAVDDELVVRVHVHPTTGQGVVEALDADTGRMRWTVPMPAADGPETRSPASLEIRGDRVLVAVSATADLPARLVSFAAGDGAVQLEVSLAMMRTVVATTWRDGTGVLYGTAESSVLLEGSPRSLLVGVGDGGEVAWQLDGYAVPDLELDREPLLVRGDAEVARLDPATGSLRWRRPAASGSARGDGVYLAIDRAGGVVRRTDPATGAVIATVEVGPVDRAVPAGPWIGVIVDGVLTLHRQTAGATELVARHEVSGPVTAARVDERVVVAMGDQEAGRVDVVAYRIVDAVAEPQQVLRGLRDVRPLELRPVTDDDPQAETGIVELVVDGGATLIRLHPSEGLIVRRERFLGDDARISWHDGLTAIRRSNGELRLQGPAGVIVVDGADELVAVRPPVVAGPGGVLALDEAMLGLD